MYARVEFRFLNWEGGPVDIGGKLGKFANFWYHIKTFFDLIMVVLYPTNFTSKSEVFLPIILLFWMWDQKLVKSAHYGGQVEAIEILVGQIFFVVVPSILAVIEFCIAYVKIWPKKCKSQVNQFFKLIWFFYKTDSTFTRKFKQNFNWNSRKSLKNLVALNLSHEKN